LASSNRDADANTGLGPVRAGGGVVAKGVDIRIVVVRARPAWDKALHVPGVSHLPGEAGA